MKRILISIDWDYFVQNKNKAVGSVRENYRNIHLRWYREYIKNPKILHMYGLLPHPEKFWEVLEQNYGIDASTFLFISDSHKYSLNLSMILGCQKVLNFDAHADLGYGGIASLKYYTHCANWLGQLLVKGRIDEAEIIYSPYTAESPRDFREFLENYRIRFERLSELPGQAEDEWVAGIHICRSGAWTPPWYDPELTRFINASPVARRRGFIKPRPWNPRALSDSEKINLLLCS